MAKQGIQDIDPEIRKEILVHFLTIIEKRKNKQEVAQLFLALMTAGEGIMFGRRLQTALLLHEGKSHREIREALGVGFNTIKGVAVALSNEEKTLGKWIAVASKDKRMMKKRSSAWYDRVLSPYGQLRIIQDILDH